MMLDWDFDWDNQQLHKSLVRELALSVLSMKWIILLISFNEIRIHDFVLI